MLAAYRGYSVILFAPLAALGAVLLTPPAAVAPVFSDIFMDKLVGFVKLYFPVFLLGAVFERFLARYVSINSFTETVIRTRERGEIMRWKAQPGRRPTL